MMPFAIVSKPTFAEEIKIGKLTAAIGDEAWNHSEWI